MRCTTQCNKFSPGRDDLGFVCTRLATPYLDQMCEASVVCCLCCSDSDGVCTFSCAVLPTGGAPCTSYACARAWTDGSQNHIKGAAESVVIHNPYMVFLLLWGSLALFEFTGRQLSRVLCSAPLTTLFLSTPAGGTDGQQRHPCCPAGEGTLGEDPAGTGGPPHPCGAQARCVFFLASATLP